MFFLCSFCFLSVFFLCSTFFLFFCFSVFLFFLVFFCFFCLPCFLSIISLLFPCFLPVFVLYSSYVLRSSCILLVKRCANGTRPAPFKPASGCSRSLVYTKKPKGMFRKIQRFSLDRSPPQPGFPAGGRTPVHTKTPGRLIQLTAGSPLFFPFPWNCQE